MMEFIKLGYIKVSSLAVIMAQIVSGFRVSVFLLHQYFAPNANIENFTQFNFILYGIYNILRYDVYIYI